MAAQWKLFALLLGAWFAMTAQAAEINFSSEHDFTEVNLNIRDQRQANSDFVALSVTLTPAARRRLEDVTRDDLNQQLTIVLDGKAINTATVRNVLTSPRLSIILSRQMAREVFPSLLATPVSSVSLSGLSMPDWTQGRWLQSPAADAPGTGEALSISAKILNGATCKRVNHTVVASSDSMVELRIDRRNKCVLDDVAVSKIILTRTPESGRIVISLYAIGNEFSAAPARENTYLRQ
jgi:hypothetical protein